MPKPMRASSAKSTMIMMAMVSFSLTILPAAFGEIRGKRLEVSCKRDQVGQMAASRWNEHHEDAECEPAASSVGMRMASRVARASPRQCRLSDLLARECLDFWNWSAVLRIEPRADLTCLCRWACFNLKFRYNEAHLVSPGDKNEVCDSARREKLQSVKRWLSRLKCTVTRTIEGVWTAVRLRWETLKAGRKSWKAETRTHKREFQQQSCVW